MDKGINMHVVQRIAAIVLTLGLAAGFSGCGFHLKGTNPAATPMVYNKLSLQMPKSAQSLEHKLSVYLTAAGVQMSDGSDAYVLRVLEYTPRRNELRGKLVETVLSLGVTFQIEDREGRPVTEPRRVFSTRSYQYDVETVNTDDQEQVHLNEYCRYHLCNLPTGFVGFKLNVCNFVRAL